MLLTAGDLETRRTARNALRAMERLLGLRILPIVNENDTVATHEIRFGDNDRLAALVAHLVRADALVLLSDIDSLYTGRRTSPVREPDRHDRATTTTCTGSSSARSRQQRRHRRSGDQGVGRAPRRGIRHRRARHVRRPSARRWQAPTIGTWFEPDPPAAPIGRDTLKR